MAVFSFILSGDSDSSFAAHPNRNANIGNFLKTSNDFKKLFSHTRCSISEQVFLYLQKPQDYVDKRTTEMAAGP
nr:MAG TPA: hypothetical protein [Caudoviricetes sp.]